MTSKTIKAGEPINIIFNKDIKLVPNTNLSQSIYFLELKEDGNPVEDKKDNRKRLPLNQSVTVTVKDKTLTIEGLPAGLLRPGKRYQLVIPPDILIEAEDKKNRKITFNFDPVENAEN